MPDDLSLLQSSIETYFAAGSSAIGDASAMEAFLTMRAWLSAGRIRAAEPDPGAPYGWRVNAWVKRGILLGFRLGQLEAMGGHDLAFVDKGTFPARRLGVEDGVRIVAGGSAVREGAYVARSVICAPPMYINVGAYVD